MLGVVIGVLAILACVVLMVVAAIAMITFWKRLAEAVIRWVKSV